MRIDRDGGSCYLLDTLSEGVRGMTEDRLNLPFTGLVSFMRVPTCTDLEHVDADIAILGAIALAYGWKNWRRPRFR